MLLNMLPTQNTGGALNVDNALASAISKRKNKEDTNLSEKRGIGTLGDRVTESLTGIGYTISGVSKSTGGLVPDVQEMVTMDQSKAGSALDFFLQANPITGVPFTVMRNLKAMEDPEKYGKGTMYGTLMGTGKNTGLLNTLGNYFGFTTPSAVAPSSVPMGGSPYTQGNPLAQNYAGSRSSSGGAGSYNSGFDSYGGWGSEASATQGAYDEMSEDGFY